MEPVGRRSPSPPAPAPCTRVIERRRSNDLTAIAIVFIVYLGLMVFIGLKFYRKTSNLSDYILGGRKLNSWVTAMSAQASDMSGWLLIGLPGTAYVLYAGTSEAIWTAVGLMIGTYLNWLFVAKRLRRYRIRIRFTVIGGMAKTIRESKMCIRDRQDIIEILERNKVLAFE